MAERAEKVDTSESETENSPMKRNGRRAVAAQDPLGIFSQLKGNKPQPEPQPQLQLQLNAAAPQGQKINLGLTLGGPYAQTSQIRAPLPRSASLIGAAPKNENVEHVHVHPPPPFALPMPRATSFLARLAREQRNASMMAMARTRLKCRGMRYIGLNIRRRLNRRHRSFARQPMASFPARVAAWAAASAAGNPTLRRAISQIKRNLSIPKVQGSSGVKKEADSWQTLPSVEEEKANGMEIDEEEEGKVDSKPMVPANENGNLEFIPERPPKVPTPVIVDAGEAQYEVEHPMAKNKAPAVLKLGLERKRNGYEDQGINVMTEMPTVIARGYGPYGREIEGILYKYKHGNIGILCVCHGKALTPAEFVAHAGGEEFQVANPMKHITVRVAFPYI